MVDVRGGAFEVGGVRVAVPSGAITTPTGLVAGRTIGARGGEIFGTPVGITHEQALRKSVTVTWPATQATPTQLRTAVLVEWDPDAKVWRPSTVPLTLSGSSLTAHLSHFSF